MGAPVSARRTRRRASAGDAGQATVEFALVLPLVVLAALAILQVAVVVRDQVAVIHAAREAARAAALDRDPSRARAAAQRIIKSAHVEVGERGGVGSTVSVEVVYRSRTDVPLVGALFPDPTLHARAAMRVER